MISCDVIPSAPAGARTVGGGDPVGLLTDAAAVVEPDLDWSGGDVVVPFPEDEEFPGPVRSAEAVVGTTGGATGTVTGIIEPGTPADTETDMASSLVLPLLQSKRVNFSARLHQLEVSWVNYRK